MLDPIVRMLEMIYRFLASLTLAVFALITLAAVLAYATFFESRYGTHAAQESIYRSPAFALLLAVLGLNILCAATIRFRWNARWKGWPRRQTGFVITHAGLLVVLIGSWVTLETCDEGQVMLREGETTDQMVRVDHAVIRLQRLDPETGVPERGQEQTLAFRPGAFSWASSGDHLAPAGALRRDVLTDPGDPIRVVVRDFIAASSPPVWVHDPSGTLRKVYRPITLPKEQADAGIPACLVALEAGGERGEVWLRRAGDIDAPVYETLALAGKPYRLAFDFDRRSIGFDLTLVEFTMGTDPGSEEPSSYTSRVVVTDPALGVESMHAAITMNRPLRYRGQSFYQHSFRALLDPDTGRKTGDKKSVIQVGIDPYWTIRCLGCLTVVLGVVVQFSMRAGLFSRRDAAGKVPSGHPRHGAGDAFINGFEEF